MFLKKIRCNYNRISHLTTIVNSAYNFTNSERIREGIICVLNEGTIFLGPTGQLRDKRAESGMAPPFSFEHSRR